MSTRVTGAAVLLALLFFARASTSFADGWGNLSALEAGTRLRIDLADGARVNATLMMVDGNVLTVATSREVQSLARESVRRVFRARPSSALAPFIGAAIGGVGVDVAAAGESDFTGSGRAIWTGVGAGIGALGGALIRRATRFALVYQSDSSTGAP